MPGWLGFLRFGFLGAGLVIRRLRCGLNAGLLQHSFGLFCRGREHQLAQITNRGLLIRYQIAQVGERLRHTFHLAIIFLREGSASALDQLI